MKIKVGDYFDLYQEGQETRRVIATRASDKQNQCIAFCIENCTSYTVDIPNEVEKVLGNIYK